MVKMRKRRVENEDDDGDLNIKRCMSCHRKLNSRAQSAAQLANPEKVSYNTTVNIPVFESDLKKKLYFTQYPRMLPSNYLP